MVEFDFHLYSRLLIIATDHAYYYERKGGPRGTQQKNFKIGTQTTIFQQHK